MNSFLAFLTYDSSTFSFLLDGAVCPVFLAVECFGDDRVGVSREAAKVLQQVVDMVHRKGLS